MKNIVLVRIDDRLIHGQVVAKWMKKLSFNTIYVVDDAVSKDSFLCQMMVSIAPKELKVQILDEKAAAEELLKEGSPTERVCIIVKVPETLEHLYEAGVQFSEIMLGGMGSRSGRTQLIRNAAASKEERETLKRLIEKGIFVYYQDIPETAPVDLKKKL